MWHKGIPLALEVLSNLKRLAPDIKFKYLIVGDGPELKFIKRKVKENDLEPDVVFTGMIDRSELFALFNNAHFFMLLSFKEGGSWALIEAMAHGVVPIVLDAGGIRDLIRGDLGIKVKPSDSNKLTSEIANKILSLLQDRECYFKESERICEYVQSQLTWDKKIDEIMQVLKKCV
jgi:glycosyltransferase involved in cell wall biosynthesis